MTKFYLAEKVSDENFAILFEEIDFAKKIAKNADVIGEVSANKQKVISIVSQIKELRDYKEFTTDFLSAIFYLELTKLINKAGKNISILNTRLVIEKVYSQEGFKKIGKDIIDIVRIVMEFHKIGFLKQEMLILLQEINNTTIEKLETKSDNEINENAIKDISTLVDSVFNFFGKK